MWLPVTFQNSSTQNGSFDISNIATSFSHGPICKSRTRGIVTPNLGTPKVDGSILKKLSGEVTVWSYTISNPESNLSAEKQNDNISFLPLEVCIGNRTRKLCEWEVSGRARIWVSNSVRWSLVTAWSGLQCFRLRYEFVYILGNRSS